MWLLLWRQGVPSVQPCHQWSGAHRRTAWPTLSWNVTILPSPLLADQGSASRKWPRPVSHPVAESKGIQPCSPYLGFYPPRERHRDVQSPSQNSQLIPSLRELVWSGDSSLACSCPAYTAEQCFQLAFAKATCLTLHSGLFPTSQCSERLHCCVSLHTSLTHMHTRNAVIFNKTSFSPSSPENPRESSTGQRPRGQPSTSYDLQTAERSPFLAPVLISLLLWFFSFSPAFCKGHYLAQASLNLTHPWHLFLFKVALYYVRP